MTWSRRFDDPIEVGSRRLTSLRDAATYVTALPAKTAKQDHWQTAVEMLLKAAERGWPILFAEIGMRRALWHGRGDIEKKPRRNQAKSYKIIR
jgi:hypothetical protein